MTVYKVGSTGDSVRSIQQALATDGCYAGSIDGIYGGGTEAAVRQFQAARGLSVDGMVGPNTWAALFPDGQGMPDQQPAAGGLPQRCLALVGTFETGLGVPECFSGLSGNFDGQGMSFGALQWNLGQGSLQPLLKDMDARHGAILDSVFGSSATELRRMLAMGSIADQVAWAVTIQTPKYSINEPWAGYFKALGRTPEYQAIQTDASSSLYSRGLEYCRTFSLKSQRAVAQMFDIRVQNGSISSSVQQQILDDFKSIDPSDEVAKMRVVAERRSAVCKEQWIEDVRSRLMMIAEGEGVVHGMSYDLATQYALTLETAPEFAEPVVA